MGLGYTKVYIDGTKPDVLPGAFEAPTFDPQYGFPKPRLPRESKLSEKEMDALKIGKKMRDYCAHYWKDYLVCYRDTKPFVGLCNPELHAYEHCRHDDMLLRMKEYERERRLRVRAAKKAQAAS